MIHRYRITLRHDHGRVTILTTATSASAALRATMYAERAPDRSVLAVEDLGPVIS